MAQIKTFPQVIFVTVEQEKDDEHWMLASLTKKDALSDNELAIVGMYQFVSAETVRDGQVVATKRKTRKTA
jgi:hypothetical protein